MKLTGFLTAMIIAFTALYLRSCEIDYYTTTEYTISNHTNLEVEVLVNRFYADGEGFIHWKSIELQPNGSATYMYEADGKNHREMLLGGDPDSAYLVFGEKDSILYLLDDLNDHNILKLEHYNGGKISDSRYEYAFEIDEEDHRKKVNDK